MFVDHGQAADNRDALARALYGIVFNFIVAQRNFSVTKNLFFSDCPNKGYDFAMFLVVLLYQVVSIPAPDSTNTGSSEIIIEKGLSHNAEHLLK